MQKTLIIVIMGAIVLTVTGCNGSQEKKPGAAVVTSKQENKQTVEAFGIVKVPDLKNIIIDFPACVAKVNVRDGQKVKNGDSLLILDLTEYLNQISSKERQLTSEKYELQRLINSTAGDQRDLKRLQSDLTVKQEALKNDSDADMQKSLNDLKNAEDLYSKALKELTSKEVLFKSGAVPQNELDEFKKTVESKKKAVEDAKYSIEIAKTSKQKEIDQIQSNIDQKLAQLDNLQSGTEVNRIKIQREKVVGLEVEIKQMKDKLNKSYIKQNDLIADVPNGVVYEIGYVQGDIITQSKKVLSIMNLDSMLIEANVSEEFIKDVKVGAEVTIIPQADKSKSYKGKVTTIADKAVQKNGETNVPVQISIDNKDTFLLPEFNVDVRIDMSKK